jgi:hypothetical protein
MTGAACNTMPNKEAEQTQNLKINKNGREARYFWMT